MSGSDDPTTSSSSTTTTTTSPNPIVTTTANPIADAYIESGGTAATNFGTATRMPVDGSPTRQVFMRFDLTGIVGPIQSARLRIHVNRVDGSQSPSGGSVARVTETPWTESGLTYNNRPTVWGANVATLGAVNRNTWYEMNVAAAVAPGVVQTLGLRSTNGDGVYYDSRETGANAPQLIITAGTTTTITTSTTTTTTTTTTTLPPQDGIAIAAMGDLACRNGLGTNATNCRQNSVSDMIVNDPSITTFIALGDLQYEAGELANFQGSYDASYGRVKSITRPNPGNHEYGTPGASGYYTYFGAAAGDPTKGYYSFDIGTQWHVVLLNGNCGIVACSAGSTQTQWLDADLTANTRPCVIAGWHQPRWSSGTEHGSDAAFAPWWNELQAHNAELVLNGHEHSYERFAPQLPNGVASENGIREIVAGTGGRSLYTFSTPVTNSVVRLATFGLFKMVLGDGVYSWQFIGQDGTIFDSGTGTCH